MDASAQWREAQERVIELVTGSSADELGSTVPACPDWTARELVAHMVGVGADIVTTGPPDEFDPDWTQSHVDKRRDATVDDLVSEWRAITDDVSSWIDANGPDPLADITIHEQDLRGALGHPGAHDTPALHGIRDQLAGQFADTVGDSGTVALVGQDWSFRTDTRGPQDADAPQADVVVTAPDFELARALMSRRSEQQLREWTTSGDVGDHLDAFGGLGDLPTTALSEG